MQPARILIDDSIPVSDELHLLPVIAERRFPRLYAAGKSEGVLCERHTIQTLHVDDKALITRSFNRVCGVWRPDEGREVQGKADIIVGKQRNGPLGDIPLAFVSRYAKFENLAPAGFDVVPVGAGEETPF